jgi:hypothetical protein
MINNSQLSFSMNGLMRSLILILCTSTLFVFPGITMATEEPKFTLIEKDRSFELRVYQPKLIAEVEVDGDMSEASGKGFRLIADFIFGNNTAQSGKREKISMTAPVALKPAAEKIAMTSPVGIQQSEKGWSVSFVMPSQYTLDTLPKPNSPRVNIKLITAQKLAVIRFSGLVDEEKLHAKSAELNQWITQTNFKVLGTPELARYNPPWTLPFLRRNELMVEVE